MIKKIFVYSTIVIMGLMTSCFGLFSCIEGVGDIVVETREVSDFYGVTNSGSYDVYITQADTFSLKIEAQENLLQVIETYNSGGTLLIKTREFQCIRSSSPVEIHITMPDIEQLNLTGSGMIYVPSIEGEEVELALTGSGTLDVDSVYASEFTVRHSSSGHMNMNLIQTGIGDIRLSGSGEIDFGQMDAAELQIRHSSSGTIHGGIYNAVSGDIRLSGSGRLVLDGDCETMGTSHTSSGRLDVLDVISTDVECHASGSGNTYVHADGLLDVTILGSGDVIYAGSPEEIIYRITGSGNVRPY